MTAVHKGPGYPGIRDAIQGVIPGCAHPPGKREITEDDRIICDVCEKDITKDIRGYCVPRIKET